MFKALVLAAMAAAVRADLVTNSRRVIAFISLLFNAGIYFRKRVPGNYAIRIVSPPSIITVSPVM